MEPFIKRILDQMSGVGHPKKIYSHTVSDDFTNARQGEFSKPEPLQRLL